jgi:type II secretory pathway predicted ATPase ExeA
METPHRFGSRYGEPLHKRLAQIQIYSDVRSPVRGSDMRRPPNLMKTTTAREPVRAPADLGPPSNYLDLYGLSKSPFSGATDSAGYILFGSHRRAFELLIDHMMNGRGVVVLTGEVGVGKTETLRSAAAVAAESGLQTIMVSRPSDGRISLEQLTSSLDGRPETFHESPRKALLVDDFDLLPNDCISLLLSLARQQPDDDADGSAVVLSSSAGDLMRPDAAELAGCARDTIRLLRLGPAEVRQYIERSLWVAGGTTRRLITPEAIKLITTRSDGLPGTINRVMEAALTAGFARGDVMITAKTVESVVGPPPPRQRPRPMKRELSGVTEHALQIVAAGLLVTGVTVFLYKGLTGLPEKPLPVPSNPAGMAEIQAEQPRPARPADTARLADTVKPADGVKPADTAKPADATRRTATIPPELMAALMKRGNESLDLGDVAAARLLFQRAAEGGNAAAATALGKTYDPSFTPAATPQDAGRAFEWYMNAVALGDPSAGDLLKRLVAR